MRLNTGFLRSLLMPLLHSRGCRVLDYVETLKQTSRKAIRLPMYLFMFFRLIFWNDCVHCLCLIGVCWLCGAVCTGAQSGYNTHPTYVSNFLSRLDSYFLSNEETCVSVQMYTTFKDLLKQVQHWRFLRYVNKWSNVIVHWWIQAWLQEMYVFYWESETTTRTWDALPDPASSLQTWPNLHTRSRQTSKSVSGLSWPNSTGMKLCHPSVLCDWN